MSSCDVFFSDVFSLPRSIFFSYPWVGRIFLSHNSCTLFFFLLCLSSLSSTCSLLSYLCLSLSSSFPNTNREHSATSIISSLPTYFLTLWILALIPILQKLLLRFLIVPELPDPVSCFWFLLSVWYFTLRPTSQLLETLLLRLLCQQPLLILTLSLLIFLLPYSCKCRHISLLYFSILKIHSLFDAGNVIELGVKKAVGLGSVRTAYFLNDFGQEALWISTLVCSRSGVFKP